MKRVAIVGINDDIMDSLLFELDPFKVEIVAFLDNSEDRQQCKYLNIKVTNPKSYMANDNVRDEDYFIITALSAYQTIKSQLEDLGIKSEKIMPFIPESFCKYILGEVSFDKGLINDLYIEPYKTLRILNRYQAQYIKYSSYNRMTDESDNWYNKSSLIAHALGGRIGEQKLEYTNSLEAFCTSIANEFILMECDVCVLKDKGIVLSHDNSMLWECKIRNYTTLNLEQFLENIKKNSFLTVLIDVKWEKLDDYIYVVKEIEKTIEKISQSKECYTSLKKQIVMQVYDEETIKCAKSSGFEMFFTQYRNQRKYEFMNTVDLCYRYGIRVVGMGLRPEELVQRKYMHAFFNKNIKLFGYSTDSIEEYQYLRYIGFTGVITNFLRPRDIE